MMEEYCGKYNEKAALPKQYWQLVEQQLRWPATGKLLPWAQQRSSNELENGAPIG